MLKVIQITKFTYIKIAPWHATASKNKHTKTPVPLTASSKANFKRALIALKVLDFMKRFVKMYFSYYFYMLTTSDYTVLHPSDDIITINSHRQNNNNNNYYYLLLLLLYIYIQISNRYLALNSLGKTVSRSLDFIQCCKISFSGGILSLFNTVGFS